MDDEAAIRIWAIVVVGVVIFAAVLVFGLGMFRDHVPITTASQAAQVEKVETAACEKLPDGPMASCIRNVVNTNGRGQALNNCAGLTHELPVELCTVGVMDGATPNAASQAAGVCDEITDDTQSQVTCVANALRYGGKIPKVAHKKQ